MSEYDDAEYDGDDDDERDDEYYDAIVDRDDDREYDDGELPEFVASDGDLMGLYEEGYDWLSDAEYDEVELGVDYP